MIRPRSKPRPGRLKGPDLEALRMDCWRRDHGKCQKCDCITNPFAPQEWPNSYHMSHKRGKRMWGDTLENVEVLCGSCHRRFHACGPSFEKPIKAKERA